MTFTEKATAELQRRVRRKIDDVLRGDGGRAEEPAEPAWRIDDRARARLREARDGLDRATIATIHGFCQRLLGEQAFSHGRLFQEQMVDGRALFATAFRETLRRDLAAAPEARPYLAAWLDLGKGVEDLEELLYGVTTAAGADAFLGERESPIGPRFAPERLEAAIEAFRFADCGPGGLKAALGGAKVNGGTVAAIERRLATLRAAIAEARTPEGRVRFLARIEAAERKGAIFPYLAEKLAPCAAGSGRLAALAGAVGALDGAIVPVGAAVVARLLPPVLARLVRTKRAAGLLDFSDLLHLVDDTLRGEEGEAVVARLRRRYRAALIDEFQDTDEVQWRIFSRLFLEGDAETQLYIIGDPKQAIYGFRGADVTTYLRARGEVGRVGGGRVPLTQNFRSTAPMIDACNAIFDPDGPAALFQGEIRFEPARCGRPGRLLRDGAGRCRPPLGLLAVEPRPGAELRATGARRALADRIAREIAALLAAPPRFCDEGGEPGALLAPSDVYVLTRTAAEGAEVGEALRRHRVPHAFYKQDGLLETPEAEAIADLLAAIDDPADASKRLRAFLTPFFSLSLPELAPLGALGATHPLVLRLHEWKAIADRRDYERLFCRIVDDSGLARRQLFFGGSERTVTNVQHIFELLLEEVSRARLDLHELVWLLGAWREGKRRPAGEDPDVQRLDTERQAVQVMTMHKSKGLEAAVVFVYGGLFEAPRRAEVRVHHADGRRRLYVGRPRDAAVREAVRREQQDEDERLLYVALTRAKARLYLPYFPHVPSLAGRGGEEREDEEETTLRALTGCYRAINARLCALVDDPTFAPLRELLPVPCPGDEPRAAPVDEAPARADRPDPFSGAVLPAEGTAVRPRAAPLGELRRRHVGALVTSYSAFKRLEGHAGYAAPAAEPERPGVEEEAEADPGSPLADELPGGARVGIFLHGLLEDLPLATLAGPPPLEAWAAAPDVRAFFDARFRQEGLDPRHRPACERLVYEALTAPLPIDGGALPGLSRLPRPPMREVEFLFPVDARLAPSFVTGIVDALCEHEGRLFAIDWKSDRLPAGLGADGLARHVDQNYDLQIRLYTLGALRMLAVRDEEDYEARFGGLLYVFLRARPLGSGVHFVRPAWSDVARWQAALPQDERWRRLAEA